MLVPEMNIFLLNVPKCGSSSLKWCLGYRARTQNVRLPQDMFIGHIPLSEMRSCASSVGVSIDDVRVVGVVRDPIERYLSCLNFVFADEPKYSLDNCVEMSFSKKFGGEVFYRYDILFRPVSFYLDDDVRRLDLYPFEDLSLAARSFGHVGVVPHLQKSTSRFSMDQLSAYMPDIKNFYGYDFSIYDRVRNSNPATEMKNAS